VSVLELAEQLGVAVDGVAVRMRSLVSLRYVELIDDAYAPGQEQASDGAIRAVLDARTPAPDLAGQVGRLALVSDRPARSARRP
jgi:hypothetical protein